MPYGADGVGVPSGSNRQLQFNNSGAFGGSSDLTFDDSTNVMALTGQLQIVHDSSSTGPLKMTQSDDEGPVQELIATVGAGKTINTTGSGAQLKPITGPNISDWVHYGMEKIEINGSTRWLAVYTDNH